MLHLRLELRAVEQRLEARDRELEAAPQQTADSQPAAVPTSGAAANTGQAVSSAPSPRAVPAPRGMNAPVPPTSTPPPTRRPTSRGSSPMARPAFDTALPLGRSSGTFFRQPEAASPRRPQPAEAPPRTMASVASAPQMHPLQTQMYQMPTQQHRSGVPRMMTHSPEFGTKRPQDDRTTTPATQPHGEATPRSGSSTPSFGAEGTTGFSRREMVDELTANAVNNPPLYEWPFEATDGRGHIKTPRSLSAPINVNRHKAMPEVLPPLRHTPHSPREEVPPTHSLRLSGVVPPPMPPGCSFKHGKAIPPLLPPMGNTPRG